MISLLTYSTEVTAAEPAQAAEDEDDDDRQRQHLQDGAFFSVKMSSKMKRTRNGMAPAVAPKRIMQTMAPAKYGQTYGRR